MARPKCKAYPEGSCKRVARWRLIVYIKGMKFVCLRCNEHADELGNKYTIHEKDAIPAKSRYKN